MGGEVYLAEYGRAKTIHFDLVEVDGVNLRVNAVDAGADCIVMTDEANEGTATNDFVDEGTGYSLLVSVAEMTGARITVYVIDSATKIWLDKTIQIETFGHLLSAHPSLSPYWTNGAVNDGSATTTAWTFDGFTEATANHVIGSELTFISGANAGQCRTVVGFTSTLIVVAPAFLAAPADNDEFVLRAISQTTLGVAQAPSIGEILEDVTGIAGAAMRGTDNIVPAGPTKDEMDTGLGLLATTADLLDKLGAVDEAAAAGDPSATESVMQYMKQIVNVLVGTAGIAAFPAEQAPANAINLAEVIRAIHAVTAKFAFTVANVVDANALRIDGDADAVKQLRDNLDTTQRFIVHNAFTPTTTQCQPDAVFFGDTAGTLEATDDHYNGRIMLFITGILQGQATDITDYDGTNKRFTYTALTEAPGNNDEFVVI